jgi:hypothetical protein
MSESSGPRITEVNVNVSGGGSLSLAEYGAEKVSWGCSFSRRIAIPEGWDDSMIEELELTVAGDLQSLIDMRNQPEYEAAMKAKR